MGNRSIHTLLFSGVERPRSWLDALFLML